jgi:hypothetical protein
MIAWQHLFESAVNLSSLPLRVIAPITDEYLARHDVVSNTADCCLQIDTPDVEKIGTRAIFFGKRWLVSV